MKINTANNFINHEKKQNFSGGYIIDIPKLSYPKSFTDSQVALDFRDTLDLAISKKPRKLLRRILNATGFSPIALDFMNFPGYRHIEEYMENGLTWAKSRINFRYHLGHNGTRRLEFPIPEPSKKNHRFYVLTGKEIEKFYDDEPKYRKHFRDMSKLISRSIEINNGERIEPNDRRLLRNLSDTCASIEAFNSACGTRINNFEITSKEELPNFLYKCANIWR